MTLFFLEKKNWTFSLFYANKDELIDMEAVPVFFLFCCCFFCKEFFLETTGYFLFEKKSHLSFYILYH